MQFDLALDPPPESGQLRGARLGGAFDRRHLPGICFLFLSARGPAAASNLPVITCSSHLSLLSLDAGEIRFELI